MRAIFDNPILSTKVKVEDVKLKEMMFGYFLGPFCAMISNSIFSSYLSRYYSDVLGWTKFGMFSGLLPVISILFVVAGNLLVGQKIDKTRTAAGKARPYLLIAIPLLAVSIILLFMTPEKGSNLVQMLFIALTYNFYYAIAYPCYYTAHSSMVALSTRNSDQRGILATLSNASMVAAAGIGASILVPVLLQPFMFVTGDGNVIDIEKSYANWRSISVILAIVTALGVLLEYFFTRERITEETVQAEQKKIPARQHIQACIHEKYWWMVMLFILVFQMGQFVKNTSMSYYCRWMFDSVWTASNPEAASGALMSVLGVIGGLPSAVGMVIAWPLARKMGKKRSIVCGLVFSTVGGIFAFLNIHNFTSVCAGVVLKAIGIIPSQYIMLAVLSDVLDHLEAKNGFRSDGFTMSIYAAIMGSLLGLAIGIVNGGLSLSGYDASLLRQSSTTEGMLLLVYLGADMISFVISAVLLWRMDVEKYHDSDQEIIQNSRKR